MYPAGIAAQLRSTQGFHVQMHYLNTTMSPLTVELEVVVFKSAAGTTTQHAGVFFLNNLSGMNVPAHSVKTVTASYTFKIPVKLLYATGHLHKYDNNLIATLGGQPLFDTTSWDATPFKKFTPEVDVPVGTTVTWSCEVNNTTDGTLTFGESALTNNMCIFNGQYYPVPAGADPTILGIH